MSNGIDNVTVKFTVQYNTQPGEYITVSGSIPELGKWDLNQARKMTFNEVSLFLDCRSDGLGRFVDLRDHIEKNSNSIPIQIRVC